MSTGRKIAVGLGVCVGAIAVGAGGFYAWAVSAAESILARTYEVHRQDFPIPFPLTEAEVAELRAQKLAELGATAASADPALAVPGEAPDPLADVDLDAIARERAVARGKHLVESLYPCAECHGADFGGGTMVDDPAIGTILGPNLTTGKGSRTVNYAAADWDRMVRHGVRPDEKGSPMPSKDFFAMSDQELSDIVSYIRSLPPVDAEVPAGPLAKYSYDDFHKLMTQGLRPDGSAVMSPMSSMPKFAQNMTEVELKAMYAYLQSVPAAQTVQ